MIKQFDKYNLSILREDIMSVLKVVEEKHGITFKLGCIKFSVDHFISKIESFVTDGGKIDPGKINFEKYAVSSGLKTTDYERIFTHNGQRYQICGYKISSYKYPILAKNLTDGKIYKFGSEMIKEWLEK